MGTAGRVARLPLAVGAELAELLDGLTGPRTLAQLSDSERLEVVRASARLDAWSASRRARAIAVLHESALAELAADRAELAAVAAAAAAADDAADAAAADAGPDPSPREDVQERAAADRQVAMELSLVLGVSFVVADRELDLALDLTAFPRLARALACGDLDLRQAAVMLTALHQLDLSRAPDDPVRRAHQDELLAGFLGPDDGMTDSTVTDTTACGRPYPLVRELARSGVTLWSLPPARLRAIATREAARLDRGFATERATRARSERRVEIEDHPDFCSTLYLRTGTDHASAAYRNVDDAARAARRAGDPRNLDQLRADIAVGWLTEGAYGTFVVRREGVAVDRSGDLVLPRPDSPLVHVTVAATTMLGLDEEPGILHGPRGPVPLPAGLARELAGRRGALWRRLLYDPATGVATDLSPGYRPRSRLAAFVRARDGEQTRFPTSGATRLELDHVRAYRHARPETGGQTRAGNLVAAGKRDHQLKTDRLVTVSGDANGPLTYVTPSGRRYVSHPYAYAEPRGRSPADLITPARTGRAGPAPPS